MYNLEIIYEDDSILVINKPAGLAVQGGEGVKISVDKLASQLKQRSQMVPGTISDTAADTAAVVTPLLVHRLDKDTSGVLLMAKGREEAARFSRLLSGRETSKKYIAVCAGRPKDDKGIIKDELFIHGNPKKSETRYKVLKSDNINLNSDELFEYSILELELETGRMHQIRRHLAMHGNPVLGDDKYGDFKLNKKLRKTMGLKHLLLHAWQLIINSEYRLDVKAPLPEYFLKYEAFDKLRFFF